MAVSPEQISVVVQGPVMTENGLTRECLRSLRQALPRATLILSSWEGAETDDLDFDELVLSPDPGPGVARLPDGPMPTNVNRQIVSTQAGLRLAQRPYTLKFRTDLLLAHAGFLEFFGRFPKRAAQWQRFSERMIILDHFSRNPRRGPAHLFHPSDMIGFGRTEDLRRWWEIPLSSGTPPEIHFAPEQYIWLSSLAEIEPIELPSWICDDAELLRLSELTIANNFVIVRRDQFGARLPRHPLNLGEWATLYSHSDWRRLYAKHCAGPIRTGNDWQSLLREICYQRGRKRPGFSWLRRLLAGVQTFATRL